MGHRRTFAADRVGEEQAGRPSVVIGRVWRVDRASVAQLDRDRPAAVPVPLGTAFAAVAADLDRLAADLRARGLTEAAQIVEASAQMAGDPELRDQVEREVAAGTPPPTAAVRAAEHFAGLLAGLDDPLIAARAADIRAVGRRLAAALAGAEPGGGGECGGTGRVVAGWEVTADDLLTGGPVTGAVTVVGGATAHVGIVARSLGVPILFGVDASFLDLPDGTEVLLDSRSGHVVVDPSPEDREAAAVEAARVRTRRDALARSRAAPLSTRDGHAVVVLANVATSAEAELAVRMQASGVGLLRTEMPFLGAERWPTFEQHVAELVPVLAALAGRPVTVRTLDFADDKLPPFLRTGRIAPGTTPLGSGLSLLLAEPDAFEAQLRAILQAAARCGVGVSVMIPMVDSVSTWERCRGLLDAAVRSTSLSRPPLGAMIELPDAVAVADELARTCDFFSIGTNDLTASVLGLGRRDPGLMPASVREPAVRAAIAAVVRAGHSHGRPVSVCGDAASDPTLVPDLLDLGVRTLSVAPSMMDEVRAAARAHLESRGHLE